MYAISPFTIFHPTSGGSSFAKNLFTGAVVLLSDEAKFTLDAWLGTQDTLTAPEGVADLTEQDILVSADEDQYAVWRAAMLTVRNDEAHIFTLHFEPTLQCQLDCSYCLEKGINRGRPMEEEILARSLGLKSIAEQIRPWTCFASNSSEESRSSARRCSPERYLRIMRFVIGWVLSSHSR